MSKINLLELINQSANEAAKYIKQLGGSGKIRNQLGTEELLRFHIMYNLEKILDNSLFQSPEVKIGRPRPFKDFLPEKGEYRRQPKFDLVVLTRKTWSPILIAELKFTGPNQLAKHVRTEFTRLIDIYEYRKCRKEPLPQYYGLIFYIEFIKKYRSFASSLKNQCLVQHFLPEIWLRKRPLLKERYFEIIVIEEESTEFKQTSKLY